MDIDANTIGLILLGVVLLIVLSSVFWGFIRGAKKSIFRLIWLTASAIVLFFVSPMISNAINNIDISSLNLDICGSVNTVGDIGVNIVSSFIDAEQLQSNPALLEFAQNLSAMLLNIIVFVLGFFIAKYLLWIIWAPIASKIFDKQKRERKKYEKEQAKRLKQNKGIETPKEPLPVILTVKKNKHRFWGAFVGLVIGVVISSVLFMPIIGINSIFQTVNASLNEGQEGEENTYLSTVLDETTLNLINSYENSIANKLLTYSGASFLGNIAFKNLAVIKVDNKKIELASEINNDLNIYKDIMIIKDFDVENLSQTKMNTYIESIEEILETIKASDLISVLGNNLAPIFLASYVDDESLALTGQESIDSLILESYNDYKENFDIAEIEQLLSNIVNIVKILNNKEILVPIIQKVVNTEGESFKLDDVARLVQDKLNYNKNYISENITLPIVNNLFNIKLLNGNYANIINIGFNAIFDSLGIENFEEIVVENENIENYEKGIKEGLAKIFTNSIEFFQCYNLNDGHSWCEFVEQNGTELTSATRNILKDCGEILDFIKNNLLSEDSYKNLLDFASEFINGFTEQFADISAITENLKNVQTWSTELPKFAKLYDSILLIADGKVSINDLKLDTVSGTEEQNSINLAKYNKAKDTFVKIGESLDEIIGSETSNSNAIINLSNQNSSTNANNSSPLLNNKIIKDILVELIGNGVKKDKLGYIQGKIEIPESINDSFLSIEVDDDHTIIYLILNNIYNDSLEGNKSKISSWKNEFNIIVEILKEDFNNFDFEDLSKVGEFLNKFNRSNLISKNVVDAIVCNFIDSLLSSFDSELVETIKGNIESAEEIDYVLELEYFKDLMEEIADEEEDIETKLTNLGELFNTITVGDQDKSPSLILSKEVINSLLNNFLSDTLSEFMEEGDNFEIDNDKTYDYKSELSNMFALISELNKETIDYVEVGKKIDSVNNGKMFNSIVNKLVLDMFDEVTSSFYNDYSNMIDSIRNKLNVEQNGEVINSNNKFYEHAFGELKKIFDLFDLVEEDPISYTAIGSVLDELKPGMFNDIIDGLVEKMVNDASSDLNEKYSEILSNIKDKVKTETNGEFISTTNNFYNQAFGELNNILNYMDDFENISNKENLATIGSELDIMASMQFACDKDITNDMAQEVVESLLSQSSLNSTIKSSIESVINGNDYYFNNYNEGRHAYGIANGEDFEYASYYVSSSNVGYYSSLFAAIADLIPD